MPRTALASISVAVVALAAASAPAQIPPNDAYLCYRARPSAGAAPFVPVQKSLQDAFPPIRTHWLKRVTALCNPAGVDGGGIARPADHQVAYRLRAIKGSARFTRRTVVAVDRFGTHTLRLQRPDELLVPSSKALGAGGAPPYGPPGVRHFLCYRARAERAGALPAADVADQFRTAPYELRRLAKLCLPVDKNGEDPPAPGDPARLACYRLRGAKLPRTTVSTDNQIRPETLDALRPHQLCVPALVVPDTTTSSSTSSSTIVVTTSTSGPSTTVTTTLPAPCGDPLSPPPPICWGECPAATPICAATASGCECVAGTTPCGSATFPECDGACGAGEACVVSATLGCTCNPEGLPCALAYAFTGGCGGVCPEGYTCVGPFFTPDGDGCACVPIGSTCHLTCGADPGAGNCPPGQTCGPSIPGTCFCR